MYDLFESDGINSVTEKAKLMTEVADVSGDKLENYGVIKVLIEESFEKNKGILTKQACLYCFGFLACFYVQSLSSNETLNVWLNVICLVTIVCMSIIEVLQVKSEGVFGYFSQPLNYLDNFLYIFYFVYFYHRIQEGNRGKNLIPHKEEANASWVLGNCVIGILGFLKFFTYMRISQSFSKFTILIVNVFLGLGSFITIFACLILLVDYLYKVSGSVTFDDGDFANDQVPATLADLIQGYRNAIGDIAVPTFEVWKGHDYETAIVSWQLVLFVLSTFVNVIIILNFLIAYISQVYDDIMGKEELFMLQNFADMNMEGSVIRDFISSLGGGPAIKPYQCFYVQLEVQSDRGQTHDGFVKSIKKHINRSTGQLDAKIDSIKKLTTNLERLFVKEIRNLKVIMAKNPDEDQEETKEEAYIRMNKAALLM